MLPVFIAGFLIVGITGGCVCIGPKKVEPVNTLHIASRGKIKGLDPAMADDLFSATEVGRVYEGLLQYHYLKRPYVLVPNLAESMPEVSEDGRVYTFRLTKGVLFQDDPCFKETGGRGREVTADDVVYSLKRLADPKLVSTGWWILDGKVVGLNAWRDEAATAGTTDYLKSVEGLKAVDPYTIRIELVQRSPRFLFALAMPFASVVPREAVEAYGKEFVHHPVGTGPFRLAEHGSSSLVWTRNPTYRKELYPSEGEAGDKEAGVLEDAGKALPRSERVVVQVFEEVQPMWQNFMAGQLDYFGDVMPKSKDLTPEFKQKGMRLYKASDFGVTYFSFNMADEIVGRNRLLRQALSLAYDQEGYSEIFHGGDALSAQGPIPPGLAGYDRRLKNPYRQFNVAKAKELLAKAGYPGGKELPPIEFVMPSDSVSRQSAEYAARMFGAIGVKLKVSTHAWPEFQSAVRSKRGQLWFSDRRADYPDAENFIQLFYGKNVSSGLNEANYSNPEFDRLYERAQTVSDSPERSALYRRMVGIVMEDCPWIFGAHKVKYVLVQPWLKGFKLHDFDHGAAKYLRVDKAR